MTYKPLHDPTHLYFVTSTLVEWQPLFAHHQYASVVLNSLQWHREQERILLFAFVVMPTHLHWIGKPCDPFEISNVLESFYSSACFYDRGQEPIIPVDDVRPWLV